ncbi:sensor histidine kinase [Komagataeibacter swingsii]|uniref:sensor histidine kinase n=1 Tax=Komagataeibacter swingsii TaxID=215220 RepID=UPI0034E5917C
MWDVKTRPVRACRFVDKRVKSSGNNIYIEIADNGPGIPAEAMQRVFDRFVRLDTSRTHEGNGLGLSMVKAIVRLHAGAIALYDNSPGLRCVIQLPQELHPAATVRHGADFPRRSDRLGAQSAGNADPANF